MKFCVKISSKTDLQIWPSVNTSTSVKIKIFGKSILFWRPLIRTLSSLLPVKHVQEPVLQSVVFKSLIQLNNIQWMWVMVNSRDWLWSTFLCRLSCSVGEDGRAESKQELCLRLSSARYLECRSLYLLRHRELWLHWRVSRDQIIPRRPGRTFQDTTLQGVLIVCRYL